MHVSDSDILADILGDASPETAERVQLALRVDRQASQARDLLEQAVDAARDDDACV